MGDKNWREGKGREGKGRWREEWTSFIYRYISVISKSHSHIFTVYLDLHRLKHGHSLLQCPQSGLDVSLSDLNHLQGVSDILVLHIH